MPGSASDAGFEAFISFWPFLCFIYHSDLITSGEVFDIGCFFLIVPISYCENMELPVSWRCYSSKGNQCMGNKYH